MQPIIFPEGKHTKQLIKKFQKTNPVWSVNDIYEQQLRELFEITFPSLIGTAQFEKKQQEFVQKKMKGVFAGTWIYFPWSGHFIHMVNEDDYYALRTNRNKNLITKKEQKILKNTTVGIVGLSVGSGIATGLAYQGIADTMKLAEFDSLETSNLNRIRAGIHHIGLPKIEIAERQVYEINPFSSLVSFPDGLNEKNLDKFVMGKPKPKIIFEIIDDFVMKIKLRVAARKAGIPVITPANLGDSILFDIERYDLNKKLPLFNGVLGPLPEEILQHPDEDKNKYAVMMVGRENVPERAMNSVREIRKTLVGRPQLSSTVGVSGALAAYFVRKITLKEKLASGRVRVAFDEIFDKIR